MFPAHRHYVASSLLLQDETRIVGHAETTIPSQLQLNTSLKPTALEQTTTRDLLSITE